MIHIYIYIYIIHIRETATEFFLHPFQDGKFVKYQLQQLNKQFRLIDPVAACTHVRAWKRTYLHMSGMSTMLTSVRQPF
jgi:hypothetical protein